MKLSVEISMYPLKDEFIPAIQNFIDRLNTHPALQVLTNTMSTQVFGDYDAVMDVLKKKYVCLTNNLAALFLSASLSMAI